MGKDKDDEEKVQDSENQNQENIEDNAEPYDALSEFEDASSEENDEESELQKIKKSQLNDVESRISQILKSSNIEIVDENLGDEYESEYESDEQQKSQQDYDTLKALFGDKDKKKDQLTLEIDDFDYTYVGKYLEEFDLMHLKIKRIRLKKKYSKKAKTLIASALILVFLGFSGLIGYLVTRKTPIEIVSIALSQTESTQEYFVGEEFKFDGLYIYVKYSNGTRKNIKLDYSYVYKTEGGIANPTTNSVKFGGGNVTFKFLYEGNLLNYNVVVKSKPIDNIDVVYTDKIFSHSSGEYITDRELKVLISYANYGLVNDAVLDNVRLQFGGSSSIVTYERGLGWRVPNTFQTVTVSYVSQQGIFEKTIRK